MNKLILYILLFIPVFVPAQEYKGGSGSGADISIYNSPNNLFVGGQGDGYNHFLLSSTFNLFAGGEGDGFSLFKYFSAFSLFKGGEGDGYVKGDYLYYHLWTGAVNADWNNSHNWTLNIIPDINTRAQIPVVGMGQFYPKLTTGSFHIGEGVIGPNYLCRALWIHPNAQLAQAIGVSAENFGDILIEGSYFIENLNLSTFTNKPGSTLRIEGNGLFQANN